MGYASTRHENRRTGMTTYYSRCPCINLKGNWLAEAGFTTDTPVSVAIEHGLLVIRSMAE